MVKQDIKDFAKYTKKVLSVEEMRAIDKNLRSLGIPELTLMENAGTAVADFVSSKLRSRKNVLVVCGTGGAGGDGFVTARVLSDKHNVTVALLGQKEFIKSRAADTNLRLLLQNSAVKVIENAQYHIPNLLEQSDVLVIAIFGIGFHGPMNPETADTIQKLNKSGKTIFAIDVPSGLGVGSDKKNAIKADYTITLHKMKDILVKSPNAGKVITVDIGLPIEAELYAGPGDIWLATQPRNPNSSKKDNGSVMVIGGSEEFHGAPTLASNAAYTTLAALRAGIGYTTTFVPKSILNPVRSLSPNIIVKPLSGDNIVSKDLKLLEEQVKKADAVAIGPGLGRNDESLKTISELISDISKQGKRSVIDADALYAVKLNRKLSKDMLLTPNDHEFELFHKEKLDANDTNARSEAAIKVANHLGTNILLKGHTTIITDGSRLKMVVARSSALATMGTGDVLTGIIAGFAARCKDMFLAAVAGAYAHTAAGEALHKLKGDHILASDLIEYMPQILKEFDKEQR